MPHSFVFFFVHNLSKTFILMVLIIVTFSVIVNHFPSKSFTKTTWGFCAYCHVIEQGGYGSKGPGRGTPMATRLMLLAIKRL